LYPNFEVQLYTKLYGGVAQVVEQLPSKYKTLRLSSGAMKKIKQAKIK
jgi:ribosomal protein L2